MRWLNEGIREREARRDRYREGAEVRDGLRKEEEDEQAAALEELHEMVVLADSETCNHIDFVFEDGRDVMKTHGSTGFLSYHIYI